MKRRSARAIVIVAAIFALLTYLFAWSPIFQVKRVDVTGLPTGISQPSIIAQAGISIGDKLARIEPRTVKRSLSDFNWIDQIEISRDWLGGSISIAITPKIAVGIYRGRALDKTGSIFDLPSEMPNDLPVVSSSTPQLGLVAIDLFASLPDDLRLSLISLNAAHESSISSIHQKGKGTLTIQWGALRELPLKVKVYRALLALPENKKIVRMDLSAPHAPIVK